MGELLPWLVAAALAVVTYFSVRLGLRERRRRHGRPLLDKSPVKLVSPADVSPAFAVTDLGVTRDSEVVLVGDIGAHASVSTHEAWILATLAKTSHAIFEFGTCTGRTTYLLARNSPADAVVGTITLTPDCVEQYLEDDLDPQSDRWTRVALQESRYERFFHEGTEVALKVRQIFGDSKVFYESDWSAGAISSSSTAATRTLM